MRGITAEQYSEYERRLRDAAFYERYMPGGDGKAGSGKRKRKEPGGNSLFSKRAGGGISLFRLCRLFFQVPG